MPGTPPPQDHPFQTHNASHVRILTIVFLYGFFASLWILFSDKAVQWLFPEPSDFALVSTLKGFAFVAITSSLLYLLMRRMLGAGTRISASPHNRRQLLWSIGPLAVVIVLMTATGIYHEVVYRWHRAAAQLQDIADLKTRQIEDWLAERHGDANFLRTSPSWDLIYRRWPEVNDAAGLRLFQDRIDAFRKYKAYQDILLLNDKGQLEWDSQGGAHPPHLEVRSPVAQQAIADNRVTQFGPYRDAGGCLHIDFFAPLALSDGEPGAAVILGVDPSEQLFPAFQAWPAPSPSGETLIFRQDGDQVLYLSALRHQPDAAGQLRQPLTRGDLLAVKMLKASGARNRPMKGVDYHGNPVIGIGRPIRGTDWYLAAQLDQSEVFASAAKDAGWIALAGFLALFFTAAGGLLIRQRQELAAVLRESEANAEKLRALQLLEAISEASKDAIFAKDTHGRYLLFNREACRLVNQPRSEVLGRDDTAFLPPDQAGLIMTNDRKVMAEMRTVTFHEQIQTADGLRHFMATKGPLCGADGRIIGLFGVSRDISELKRAETVLRETTDRLRLFIEHAPVALAMFDRQMCYLNASRRWLTDYNLKQHDLAGLCHYDVFPEIPEAWKAVHRRALAGEVVRNERDRFERADATVHWERWEVRPWRDAAGAVAGIVIFSEDITARVEAERELADREKYLRAILQTAADGFWVLDADGTILDVNEAYCRMSGYRRDELIGSSIAALEVIEPHQEVIQHITRVSSQGSGLFETRHRTKDGHIIDVEVSVTAMESGALRKICFCRDITERKRAEAESAELQVRIQQAQKMESIGNLAGGIAHDFNNILFPILGFAEMLLDDLAADASKAENVREIIGAAKRGSELVRQILTFSRQTEQKMIPVRAQQVLGEVLKLTRATIPSDLHISQDIQTDCPLVMADPTRLHQIAMNLITNAYHAVEQNRGSIQVSLKETEVGVDDQVHNGIAPGRYAVISISDTGCGIDPAVMPKIFEPYFTTKEKGKGTGLGLSVVYGIVREHKGDIKVSSEPGSGASFHVYLPLMEKFTEAPSPDTRLPLPTGSERILLVDDEASVVLMEKRILERLGYQVESFTSSLQALAAFQAAPQAFDVLLTDMTMPNMTGDQLAKAMQAIRPDLPAIVCTGFSERITPEKAAAMGIGGFLMKPVVRAELARTIREVLDLHEAQNRK